MDNNQIESCETDLSQSQVDLDAEFARSLQMEDEQQSRVYPNLAPNRQDYRQDQAGFTNPGAGGLPYQPRVRRNQPPQQSQQGYGQQQNDFNHDRYNMPADGPPPGAGPGMLQMEEKLQRAAEGESG